MTTVTTILDLPIEIRELIVRKAVSYPYTKALEVASVNREFQQHVIHSAPREMTISSGVVPASAAGHVYYKNPETLKLGEFDILLEKIIGMLQNPDRRHDISIKIGVRTAIDINRFSGCKVLDIGFMLNTNIAPGPDVDMLVYRFDNHENIIKVFKGADLRNLCIMNRDDDYVGHMINTVAGLRYAPGFSIRFRLDRDEISFDPFVEAIHQAGEFEGNAERVDQFPNLYKVELWDCDSIVDLNTGPITPVLIPSTDPFKPEVCYTHLTHVMLVGDVDNVDAVTLVTHLDVADTNVRRLPVPNRITYLACRIDVDLQHAVHVVDLKLRGLRDDDTPTLQVPSLLHIQKLRDLYICATDFLGDCIVDTPVDIFILSTCDIESKVIVNARDVTLHMVNSRELMSITNNSPISELTIENTHVDRINIPGLTKLTSDSHLRFRFLMNCPELVEIKCKLMRLNPEILYGLPKLQILNIYSFTSDCEISDLNFPVLRKLTVESANNAIKVTKKKKLELLII